VAGTRPQHHLKNSDGKKKPDNDDPAGSVSQSDGAAARKDAEKHGKPARPRKAKGRATSASAPYRIADARQTVHVPSASMVFQTPYSDALTVVVLKFCNDQYMNIKTRNFF
jgi:hypothetical protein